MTHGKILELINKELTFLFSWELKPESDDDVCHPISYAKPTPTPVGLRHFPLSLGS
jgi:hypothetical protein